MNKNSILNRKSLNILAPAKLNLHLQILGLRNDNYHEMAMVMQSIDLYDKITILNTSEEDLTLETESTELGNSDENLIIKAAKLLKNYSSKTNLGARIKLQKNIPIGAGLAGGSSDAAATLFGLNKLWELGYSNKKLEFLCSQIGSDIPFCLSGGTQLCFGRGEILEPVYLENNSMAVILVKDPNANVSTPWAYSLSKQYNINNYLSTESEFEHHRNLLRNAKWLKNLTPFNPPPLQNDLQYFISPRIASVKRALDILNSIPEALAFAMSGSGPSCFAIFSDLKSAQFALEKNKSSFINAGLETWCCSFINKGVNLDL